MSDVLQGRAGGPGGIPFEGYAVPEGARLTEVHVFAEQFVHAIQFVYIDVVGERVELPRIGGEGGVHHAFILGPEEYLSAISGLADWYIDQIRFHTNLRVSEDYGSDGTALEFTIEAPRGHAIVGLYGRADWFIDSLGIIARRIASKLPDHVVEPALESAVEPAPEPAAEPALEPAAEPAPESAAEPPAREARPKDLEKVEGIGPKIAALLVSNGILDLADLAATPAEKVKAILTAAGSRYAIADPTTWPEQAALGAKGDWDGFAALQKKLKGGRRG
ncbi:MAG: hypothetical protein HGA65_19705 [Oscillochloris sp.]|nr:hypothetical protein [Oscillochloris sp.]